MMEIVSMKMLSWNAKEPLWWSVSIGSAPIFYLSSQVCETSQPMRQDAPLVTVDGVDAVNVTLDAVERWNQTCNGCSHDDVIKHFQHYWPLVWGIHPHKGQWRGALMFSLILRLNKLLCKQWWGWWFETSSRPLWHHCNVYKYDGAKATDMAETIFNFHCWLSVSHVDDQYISAFTQALDTEVFQNVVDENIHTTQRVILVLLALTCQFPNFPPDLRRDSSPYPYCPIGQWKVFTCRKWIDFYIT